MQLQRGRDDSAFRTSRSAGATPLQAAIICGRVCGEQAANDIFNVDLQNLPNYTSLMNAERAGELIADVIIQKKRIGILTDYDVDGISSNAVLQHAICAMANVPADNVFVLLGHRMQDGYGISHGLTQKILAMPVRPELIVSADCGSSDEERIAMLAKAGIQVIVTDHHEIPKSGIPTSALLTVNPCQAGDTFADKNIAGVAVAWYVMWATLSHLHGRGYPLRSTAIQDLLDFVALGTVADCVSIASRCNRTFIQHGLRMMNRGIRPCWRAALQQLGKSNFDEGDLGFQIGPRINARSRMDDPYMSVDFLMSATQQDADDAFRVISQDNERRKTKERDMVDISTIDAAAQMTDEDRVGLVVYDQSFHPGVQGIVASRLVERTGLPSMVFSPSGHGGLLSGSGRTIDRIHIRKVLQFIDDCDPTIIDRFGGHKGACGAHIHAKRLDDFRSLFQEGIRTQIGDATLEPTVITDGDLTQIGVLSLQHVKEIAQLKPFGREFEEPLFSSEFLVKGFRMIGGNNHASLIIQDKTGYEYKAVWFNCTNHLKFETVSIGCRHLFHYRLNENQYNGNVTLQLLISGID